MQLKLDAAQIDEAIALIADEANWTQGTLARERNSRPVRPGSPNAVQWCGIASIMRTVHRIDQIDVVLALRDIDPETMQLSMINDYYGHGAAIAEMGRLAGLVRRGDGCVPMTQLPMW